MNFIFRIQAYEIQKMIFILKTSNLYIMFFLRYLKLIQKKSAKNICPELCQNSKQYPLLYQLFCIQKHQLADKL